MAKLINQLLLREVAALCWCDLCQRHFPGGVDPDHILTRGMGGGGRIDLPENLAALCRVCHTKRHNGQVPIRLLWEAVAKRLGKTAEECERIVREQQRRRK